MKTQYTYIIPDVSNKRFSIFLQKQLHINQNEIFKPHWHEHFELLFILEGKLRLTCNAETFYAKEGDLVLLNPNDLHQIHSISGKLEYYCLVFDLNLLASISNDPGDLDFILPLKENKIIFSTISQYSQEQYNCISKLFKEYNEENLAKNLLIKSYLMELISLLFRQCEFYKMNMEKRDNNVKVIQRILLYLNKNFDKKIEIKELSHKFNVSYHHLCHLFKRYTNKSIIQYLSELRVESSLNYLENTSYSITEISSLVGYQDSNYFSRTFKKIMKITPREYIKTLNLQEF